MGNKHMLKFAVAFDYTGKQMQQRPEARCCIVCGDRLSTYNTGVACARHPAERVETAMLAKGMKVRRIGHVVKNVRAPASIARR